MTTQNTETVTITPAAPNAAKREPTRPATKPAESVKDAEYWRTKYEEQRLRLAKLWVAYRDVEHELDALKGAKKDAAAKSDGAKSEAAAAPKPEAPHSMQPTAPAAVAEKTP